jgi:hypothetical protein
MKARKNNKKDKESEGLENDVERKELSRRVFEGINTRGMLGKIKW